MRFAAWHDSLQMPALLTPWSLAHFASGVVAAACARAFSRAGFGDAFRTWLVLHLLYELKDQVRAALGHLGPTRGYQPLPLSHTTNNSPLNTAGDQTASALGFVLAWTLRAPLVEAAAASALLFVVLASSAMSRSGTEAIPLWQVWDRRD